MIPMARPSTLSSTDSGSGRHEHERGARPDTHEERPGESRKGRVAANSSDHHAQRAAQQDGIPEKRDELERVAELSCCAREIDATEVWFR